MISKQQLKIFNVFRVDLFKEWTFKEIKKTLSEKSNNKLQLSLKTFEKEDLIKLKKIGKTNVYSVNFKSNKALVYMGLCFLEFPPKGMPFETLYGLQESIIKKTELFSLIVFGSFAKGEATKNSDLDVAILVEDEKTKKEINPLMETVKRKDLIEIHYNIFTNEEFLEMLLIEQENVGKEICRNHFIFYNPESFYKLIIRGFEHGFDG